MIRTTLPLRGATLALALGSMFGSAQAGSALTAIDVARETDARQTVRLTFDGPAETPSGFIVGDPPRIALDFPETPVRLAAPRKTFDGQNLRGISAVEADGRARVVLSLAKAARYETRVSGNQLLVSLDADAPGGGLQPVAYTPEAAAPVAAGSAVTAVDFQRGKGGEGRLVLDLSSSDVPVTVRKDGRRVVVEARDTRLAAGLERKLDVNDFATPVRTVETSRRGGAVRVVLDTNGAYEMSSYQTDRRYVVEVRPLTQAEQVGRATNRTPVYKGQKLSLNFQNVEVRTVLQVLAEFTGLNIVASDTVTGNITLRLKDVPWDQALDIILQARGLDQRRSGNVIRIAPREELAAKEKQELESRQQISELEPLRSESMQLRYGKAEDFKKFLTDDKQSILTKRGSVLVESRTNTLIVQDVPSKLEEVRQLIDRLDVPVKQVLIEARIVEALDDFSRDLGARLSYRKNFNHASFGFDTNGGTTSSTAGSNINLPTVSNGVILGGLYQGASHLIGLELEAAQQDNKTKIISSPRLVTADRIEAVIEDGQEIPYLEQSSAGNTSIAFKKAVLSLKVKPQITPDGNVILDVKVNKDSPISVKTLVGDTTAGLLGNNIAINTSQVQTQVLVENGNTVVIGGLNRSEDGNEVNGVPWLSDIPILGYLFKTVGKTEKKRELLIFLTPKVLDGDMMAR